MKHHGLLSLGVGLALSCGSLACATGPPAGGPASTSSPTVRCHTVLEVRPGVLGSASNPVPVQQCEPEVPAPEPSRQGAPPSSEDDEAPLGAGTAPAPPAP